MVSTRKGSRNKDFKELTGLRKLLSTIIIGHYKEDVDLQTSLNENFSL